MMMMTIQEFCAHHDACPEGRDWAIENCRDMNHAWETLRPDWLVWVATRPGVLDDRTLRLFAVWCARRVQHLLTDPRSIAALAAERHAHGQATDEELSSARDAAWSAARAAASDAARDAARAAALAAARDAARAAALAAAREAARAAAGAAAGAAQAAWLRANATPCFDGGGPRDGHTVG
jgi:hypothetical protein